MYTEIEILLFRSTEGGRRRGGDGQIYWRANLESNTAAPTQKQRDSSGTLIRLRYQKIGTGAHNGNKNFSWSGEPKHSGNPGTVADSPAQTL